MAIVAELVPAKEAKEPVFKNKLTLLDCRRVLAIGKEFGKSKLYNECANPYANPNFERLGRLAGKMAKRHPDYANGVISCLVENHSYDHFALQAVNRIMRNLKKESLITRIWNSISRFINGPDPGIDPAKVAFNNKQ